MGNMICKCFFLLKKLLLNCYELVENKTMETDSKRRKQKRNLKKRKPFDLSDSDPVELSIPIATPFFVFERKASYTSNCDSASAFYVAGGREPALMIYLRCYATKTKHQHFNLQGHMCSEYLR